MPPQPDSKPFHGFCLAAPHSGGGKTTVALALMRALVRRGLSVQGFKCGPDYIDPSFHRQATGRPSLNIDTWMMGRDGVRSIWHRHAASADIGLCEGVMGLFDSRAPGDLSGSTADCALALGLPVILVVPAKGMAASISALVAGYAHYHPGLRIAGIIANRVGSPSHTRILAESLRRDHLPPLLGAIPHNASWALDSRQLGLVPAEETPCGSDWYDTLADAAEQSVDLDALLELTRLPRPEPVHPVPASSGTRRRLAVARDRAFCFYYDDNLSRLEQLGWEILPFSPLHDTALPAGTDAVYLGGGYPETFARELSANEAMRRALRQHADGGKEIFAECGGYMYLCRTLVTPDGTEWPMSGILDATARMGSALRSLGYREVSIPGTSPLGLERTTLRGHEFHWSSIEHHRDYQPLYTWTGRDGSACRDGVSHGNIRAGYIHLYWAQPLPTPETAARLQGKIILLNGPSSAGKTTLAQALRRLSPRPVMIFSVDDFLPACGTASSTLTGTLDASGLPLVEAYHAALAAAARAGACVIADHVIGENPDWIHDLCRRLGSVPLHTVRVHCDRETLVRRETTRTDRPPDIPHALRQMDTIHRGIPCCTSIDTTAATPDDCARQLLHLLSEPTEP